MYENLYYFLNEILVDFGSPGAAFGGRGPRNLKGGKNDLASRATKFLSYLAAW